jgi:hypothetical protein
MRLPDGDELLHHRHTRAQDVGPTPRPRPRRPSPPRCAPGSSPPSAPTTTGSGGRATRRARAAPSRGWLPAPSCPKRPPRRQRTPTPPSGCAVGADGGHGRVAHPRGGVMVLTDKLIATPGVSAVRAPPARRVVLRGSGALMPYSTAAKNLMLNALPARAASHTSARTPRRPVTRARRRSRAPPGSRSRSRRRRAARWTTPPTERSSRFPAGQTVTHIGFWSAATGGTFHGFVDVADEPFPNGGNYTVTDADLDLNAV